VFVWLNYGQRTDGVTERFVVRIARKLFCGAATRASFFVKISNTMCSPFLGRTGFRRCSP
jgi:hypothetical protein